MQQSLAVVLRIHLVGEHPVVLIDLLGGLGAHPTRVSLVHVQVGGPSLTSFRALQPPYLVLRCEVLATCFKVGNHSTGRALSGRLDRRALILGELGGGHLAVRLAQAESFGCHRDHIRHDTIVGQLVRCFQIFLKLKGAADEPSFLLFDLDTNVVIDRGF